MPLNTKIGTHKQDGWLSEGDTETQHYSYNGRILCTGAATPSSAINDNNPEIHCKSCFEQTRLLYNTDDEKVLFKKKSSD